MVLSEAIQSFVYQIGGQDKLRVLPAAAKPGFSFILENVVVDDFPIQVDRALPRFCACSIISWVRAIRPRGHSSPAPITLLRSAFPPMARSGAPEGMERHRIRDEF